MAVNAAAGGAEEPELRELRERRDRASRAMGQLLLRGYRMLGTGCPQCGTILLQDKQRQLLCVTCQDLDSDGEGPAADPSPSPSPSPSPPRPEHCEGAAAGRGGAGGGGAEAEGGGAEGGGAEGGGAEWEGGGAEWEGPVRAARAAVLAKLGWAARELPRTRTAEGSARLCLLVRACADALGGLRDLGGTPANK